MNKIEHFYQKIQGWFSFAGLYTEMVNKYDNAVFVEVGTWKGRSAAYMATEIANSEKNIKFYCIDPWTGQTLDNDPTAYDCKESRNNTLFEHFLKNIEPVKEYLTPIRGLSNTAVLKFKDNTLDFVYIDASHDYESVANDLNIWYPKLKGGGVLAGHDYIQHGVKRAVNEFTSKNNLKAQVYPTDTLSWFINL